MLDIWVALSLGLFLGYLIGWHRGVLRLPLFPRLRGGARRTPGTPVRVGPSSPTSSAAASGSDVADGGSSSEAPEPGLAPTPGLIVTPERRRKIREDLGSKYPGLDRASLDAATEEIVAAAGQMFAHRR